MYSEDNPTNHLECCIALLQIWFLEHSTLCRPLEIKDLLQKDLINAHLRRALIRKKDWPSFLENLQAELLLETQWLYIGELVTHGQTIVLYFC